MLIFGGSRETLGKGKDPIIGSSGREDTGIEDDKFMRIRRVSHHRPRGKGREDIRNWGIQYIFPQDMSMENS